LYPQPEQKKSLTKNFYQIIFSLHTLEKQNVGSTTSLIECPSGDIIQNLDPLVVTADFYTASSKPRQADAARASGGFARQAKRGDAIGQQTALFFASCRPIRHLRAAGSITNFAARAGSATE